MNNDVELIPVKGVLPSVQAQSDNVIYVPQAHKNKAGIVREGDGVLIEDGVVSLNRQTVEDMIDANKWVSYGFKQNLTEDEKGMARHNIGAGDNYFTGSYYDLTQKPHLNTDNSASLPVGDEEINDTINLHKISKTGSFNDLKHVPQETLDFAESERQKSKNLFPYETVSGNNIVQKYFNTLPAGTYTLSAIVSSATPDTQCLVEVYYKNTWLTQYKLTKSSTRTSKTRTINSQFDELRFYGGSPNYAYDFTFSQIQLEQGTVATEYQPYNGAIVHEKEIADVEHVETIYDMSSSDSNINLGYTGGIQPGTTISNLALSKYKTLRIWFGNYGNLQYQSFLTLSIAGNGSRECQTTSWNLNYQITVNKLDDTSSLTNSSGDNCNIRRIEGVY